MGYFLSKKEAELAQYVKNFQSQIGDISASVGLSAQQIDELNDAADAFEQARNKQKQLEIDLRTAQEEKLAATAHVKEKIRLIAAQIKADPNVSNSQKIKLGLPVRDEILTRHGEPDSRPFLRVEVLGGQQHKIHFRDAGNTNSKAKPPKVSGAEIWVQIGDEEIFDENEMLYLGTATRTPFLYRHKPENIGKTANYRARWVNRRGERGAWSDRSSATVAL